MAENKKSKEFTDEEEEEVEEEEDEYEKYIEDNIEKDIARTNKKIEKYSNDLKTILLKSKKSEGEQKENFRKEALRVLKLKKFYEKRLNKLNEKKNKIDMKILDKNLRQEKKELKKVTRDFKKKVALLVGNEEQNEPELEDDLSMSQLNIDMSESEVNEQYNKIISLPEVQSASDNLNVLSFFFH